MAATNHIHVLHKSIKIQEGFQKYFNRNNIQFLVPFDSLNLVYCRVFLGNPIADMSAV